MASALLTSIRTNVPYYATAAGGTAVGSMFPLFLFDKFGIAKLFTAQPLPLGAVYAFTVFAMLSFLIVGIGAVAAKGASPPAKENGVLYIVILTFAVAFAAGLIFFIFKAVWAPVPVNIDVSFERFRQEVRNFPDYPLSPYLIRPGHHTPPDEPALTDSPKTYWEDGNDTYTIGIDNLSELEADYRSIRKTVDSIQPRMFDNPAMSEICDEARFARSAQCRAWEGKLGE